MTTDVRGFIEVPIPAAGQPVESPDYGEHILAWLTLRDGSEFALGECDEVRRMPGPPVPGGVFATGRWERELPAGLAVVGVRIKSPWSDDPDGSYRQSIPYHLTSPADVIQLTFWARWLAVHHEDEFEPASKPGWFARTFLGRR